MKQKLCRIWSSAPSAANYVRAMPAMVPKKVKSEKSGNYYKWRTSLVCTAQPEEGKTWPWRIQKMREKCNEQLNDRFHCRTSRHNYQNKECMETCSYNKQNLNVDEDAYYAKTTLMKHLSRYHMKDGIECNKGAPISLYFWTDGDILNKRYHCCL